MRNISKMSKKIGFIEASKRKIMRKVDRKSYGIHEGDHPYLGIKEVSVVLCG